MPSGFIRFELFCFEDYARKKESLLNTQRRLRKELGPLVWRPSRPPVTIQAWLWRLISR